MALALMQECAGNGHGAIFHRAFLPVDFLHLRKRQRRLVDALFGGGDQRLFPHQALYLPGAKRKQDDERDAGGNKDAPRKTA